jgi:undecaprenyl-diphosphatase
MPSPVEIQTSVALGTEDAGRPGRGRGMSTVLASARSLRPVGLAGGLLLAAVSAAVLAGMNQLDEWLIGVLNAFSHRVPAFDKAVWHLANSDLLKGGVLATLTCWAWYGPDPTGHRRRGVLTAVAATYAALAITQVLAVVLPARPRPMHADWLGFQTPAGVSEDVLRGWSSFPSDHAAMFFALAAGLWLVSSRLGAWVAVYSLLLVGLARIYLGLHYPTDIVAGALIGILIAAVLGGGDWGKTWLLDLERRRPAVFYTVSFFLLYQVASMFTGPQRLMRVAWRVVRPWIQ